MSKRVPGGATKGPKRRPAPEPEPPSVPEPAAPAPRHAGWTAPHAEPLPRPTFWPASLAFAVTFMLWGIVASPYISGVGALLFAASLAGWIGDLRNETRSH